MNRIQVLPIPGTTLAESKDEARELREQQILPSLARGEPIEIDFSGVETATQSFVHALIAEAIRRYGDKAFDLLVFKTASSEVRQVVLTVFEYTLLAAETAKGIKGVQKPKG